MGSILLGAFLGLLIGMILFAVCMIVKMEVSFDKERIVNVIATVILIVSILTGGIVSGVCEKHAYESYVDEYSIAKETIENSVSNENLSGFEKAELVKQATEENKKLVKYQYTASKWYGFLITDDVFGA